MGTPLYVYPLIMKNTLGDKVHPMFLILDHLAMLYVIDFTGICFPFFQMMGLVFIIITTSLLALTNANPIGRGN